jgi:hypothetical protein
MLPAAAFCLLLAAADTVRWLAGMETQARGRTEPAADGSAGVGELDLRGQLGVSTQGPDGAMALTWSPTLLIRRAAFGAPTGGGNASRQAGRLELQTRLAPATRLASRMLIDWGLTDFSPLSGQVTTPGSTLLPPQRFVRTLGLEMMLDLTHAFSPRMRLSVSGGVQRSGGLGHDAVSVFPFQVGPQATASLAWAADRLNSVTLTASGSESRFSIGRTSVLSNLEAGWTLRALPHLLCDASTGLTVVHSFGQGASSSGAYGAGALGAAWELPVAPARALRTSLRFRLLPGLDPFTALASQTVRGEGGVEWTQGHLRLGVTAWQGHVVSGAGAGADEVRFEARASWLAARGFDLYAGMSAAWTNQLPFAGWQAQALLGLRWADRGSF